MPSVESQKSGDFNNQQMHLGEIRANPPSPFGPGLAPTNKARVPIAHSAKTQERGQCQVEKNPLNTQKEGSILFEELAR